ncbi:hypothetical protein HA050_11655 [Iodobacter sp. HSC-16F04]|uniref:Uncharacterized protein n=1 Tax=Iodobacter violaceini TaxID=3044271 RepID=A0ABX0KVQ5_9NEIS|nr:hypothetical protein [Iodobacter violacea]NHQ86773.1 hypothetical protein [Iodobacter violacea]
MFDLFRDNNFGKEAIQLDLFSYVSSTYVQAGKEAIASSLDVCLAEMSSIWLGNHLIEPEAATLTHS